jgi:TM2 domain-containing membrane protein YozV
MESILGTGAAVAPAPLEPASDKKRKRPGLAFLLSLIFPGAGLVYCGKRGAGVATAIFFCIALTLMFSLPTTNPFWGVGLRAALVLYGYAFIDSFYTAREINAGMAQYIVGNNPRIAAMLNLITTGFGYFYLGERKKGIAVFIVLRVFNSIATSAQGPSRMPMLLLLELVLVVLSIDAYRLAREQLRQAFPDVNLDPFAPGSGLPALVPAALAGFFAFNYAALACVGLLLPDFRQAGGSGSIAEQQDGTHSYVNNQYGFSVTFPGDWTVEQAQGANMFLQAKRFGGGCSVQIIGEARLPIMTATAYGAVLRKGIESNDKGFKWLSEKPATLSGLNGQEESFIASVRDIDIRQNYVVIPRGLSMFNLVETVATGLMDRCSGDFDGIRHSVHFK